MKQVDKCDSILSIVCGAHPPTASTQMNGNNKNQPPALPLSIRKKYGMMALFFLSCSFILVALLHSQWYQLTQKNAIRFPFSSILFISSKFSLSLSTSRSANAHSLQVRSLMCRALAIFPALPFRLFLFFNFIFRIHNDIYKLPIIIFHFI